MQTDTQAKKNGAEMQDPFAKEDKNVSFTEVHLSRPLFKPAKCKGPVQGFILGILGPFPPGENSLNNKPWFAYNVKLTAPCEVVGADGEKTVAKFGDEIMVAVGAQLRDAARYALDETRMYELRLTPGPQPESGKMRTWKAQKGRTVARTADFPLFKTNPESPFLLPPAAADADSENPF